MKYKADILLSSVLDAIDSQPEVYDPLPDGIWEAAKGDKRVLNQLVLFTIWVTKAEIKRGVLSIAKKGGER